MENTLFQIILSETLAMCWIIVGIIGIIIILIGVMKSLRAYLVLEFSKNKHHIDIDMVRYKLGTYLLLWLEFLVAADILETVFAPSLEKIGILWGIVIIRTILNFFLNKELERIEKKEKEV